MTNTTIIIGAGPAGIAAAIQLKRAGRRFLIFSKGPVGGLLNSANLVENYPGFPNGLKGTELASLLRQHIDKLDISVIPDDVTSADCVNGGFYVKTAAGFYESQNLIIATGTLPKSLDKSICADGAEDKIVHEVHQLKNVKRMRIAIIGGGDAAFDYALNLSYKNSVSIIYRNPKSLPLLYKRACENSSIRLYPNTEIAKIKKTKDSLHIKTTNPKHKNIPADFLLPAIGRKPDISFLSEKIKEHFLEKREIRGLYFAGDVLNGNVRQAVIAAGSGMQAAMEIILLENQ